MTRTISLIGLLALSSAVLVQAAPATGDTENAVQSLEQQWTQVQNSNNSASEAAFVADTGFFVGSDGRMLNKEQFLADEKATKYTHVAIEDVVVHAYPGTAVATYTMTVKGTSSAGKPMDTRSRVTDTWVKMPDGKWQCVASVGTPLKA